MANLLDYLTWRGDLTLDKSPFCEVDGAILARVSYFPFDLIGLKTDSVIPLGAAAAAFLDVPDIQEKVLFHEDYSLIKALLSCPRFKDMQLLFYQNTFDSASEVQFSAITIRLTGDCCYISFRGTDNTLVGWKENFNMAFECPVPAQFLAVEYLEQLLGKLSGDLMLGGHSKGGNLAVYAGAFCSEENRGRIKAVYNYDGPGFDVSVMNEIGYQHICDRVKTLIPQSSVVGMLLEHEEQYSIVHSTQMGLMQHDLYSWELQRDHFLYLEAVTDGSVFVDRTVKEWVAGMDYERRERFVDAVYEVFSETNARTLHEMNENRTSSIMAMMRSLKDMDEPSRKLVFEVIGSLMKSAGSVLAKWAKGEDGEAPKLL